METLKALLYEVLAEAQIITAMYLATISLATKRSESLTDIFTAIRAIKGVTVVTIVEPHAAVSEDKNNSILTIKFIPAKGYPLKTFLHHLKTSATNIPGVISFLFKKIDLVDTPQ